MSAFGNLSGLSAVTGERLEYWVPASVGNAIGGRGAHGFCLGNSDILPNFLRRKSMYTRNTKLALALDTLRERAMRELGELRARGVKGNIPSCFYITTGEGGVGKDMPRWHRRSTPMHERFHAEVRRVETLNNMDEGALAPYLERLIEGLPEGKKVLILARQSGWSKKPYFLAEEALARVEQIRGACQRSKEDCQSAVDYFHLTEQFKSGQRMGLTGPRVYYRYSLDTLAQAIVEKYGGALGLVGAALRLKLGGR